MTTFAALLNTYGIDAALCRGGESAPVRIFLNPILTNRSDKTWSGVTPLGTRNKARYYGFFPPETALDDCGEAYLIADGRSFDFVRAEPYRVEGQISHWEAVLKIREADAVG